MVLARWQATIVDDEGNALPNAQIEVRREVAGTPRAILFTDRDGLVPLVNPFNADAAGLAAFHVAGGAYRITATNSAFSITWRYVAIGTASEFDAGAVPALVQNVDSGYALAFESQTTAPPSPGAIRFNDANLAAATLAFVSVQNLAGSTIQARLLELFNSARSTKDTIVLTNPAGNAQASFRVDNAALVGSTHVVLTIAAPSGATSFPAGERVNLQRERAGADGPQGIQGVQGVQGIQGLKGDKGDIGATCPAGPGTGDMLRANNLSDVANAATARTNIGAAAQSHAHAIADVTNLQAALDGKAVSTHDHAGQALIPDTLRITRASQLTAGVNLDTILVGGLYDVSAATNKPAGSSSWGYLHVQRHSNADTFVAQTWINLDDANTNMWVRTRTSGTWGAWRQILYGNVVGQSVTGGARIPLKQVASATSGQTITPDPGNGPHQQVINNGAFTLAAPTQEGSLVLYIFNTTGAGACTFSGFAKVDGDTFNTATANWLVFIFVLGGLKYATVKSVS